ncbi:MAG: translation initiation factor IF-3 [Planctomycetes bacterium]|nr:translation initiation factor IF-3 [Planctomycetota bacterium]MCP4838099.1 translation initiation factor IF-3 [Planctomycetota bacterium]
MIARRRRYFGQQENIRKLPRVNDQIRKSPIRLIDQDENMIGVVDVRDAIQMATEAGLDLVEVSPEADPPVCRILDFGKYRYEQSKKEKSNRAKSKSAEMKEVRLGRSMKIDPHDIGIRMDQARKFLMDGHKVQIVQNFRGREMLHKERGNKRMADVIEQLADISRVEMTPRMAGRRMSLILAPDKGKIDRIKSAEQRKTQQSKAPTPEAEDAPAVIENEASPQADSNETAASTD